MSNPFRGEAELAVGDERLTLVFDINGLILAEEETGLDLKAMLEAVDGPLKLKLIRALLWAALSQRHPCNLLRAGEIVGEAGIKQTHAAITRALAAAFPKPEPKKQGAQADPQKAAGGTGNAS